MNLRSFAGTPLLWPVRCISAAAVAVLAWLVQQKMAGHISSVAGCGGEGGCGDVMGGAWSEWFRIPVTVLALLIHAGILVLTLPGVQTRLGRTGDQLLAAGGIILGGAALYFLCILYMVEKKHCPWCLGLHVAGLVEAILLLLHAVRAQRSGERGVLEAAALTGAAGIAVLAAGQIWGPRPITYEITRETIAGGPAQPAERPARPVPFFNGAMNFDAAALPISGEPDARVVLVEFFDYTCGSCRDLAGDLEALKKKHPGVFSIILLPAPLHRACHPGLKPAVKDHEGACELAKLSLAVWRADRGKFADFHRLLFTLPLPATAERVNEARRKAEQTVGAEALRKAEADPWIAERLKENFDLYAKLTTQNIKMPKLLLHTDVMMHGTAADTGSFVQEIERQFDLTRSGTPVISVPK